MTERFRDLTLVADGDGYILGSRHAADYVAVPRVGGLVVQWLQDGCDIDECARRAEEHSGGAVDVAGFVAGLEVAGLLTAPGTDSEADVEQPPRGRRLGQILFGRVGVTVQAALAAVGAVLLLIRPELRPVYADAVVTSIPLLSILITSVIATALTMVHEFAHLLAAAARGVPASISMGRRLWSLVFQTDLSRMWMIPRRQRVLPLAAGLLVDTAVMGILLALLAGPLRDTAPLLEAMLRAAVLNRFGSLVFQFEVFMRTDLYAIFVVVTGSRNLWTTKGAVARRLIGRATPDDLAHLDAVGPREARWGAAYLLLYVPGVIWGTWYYVKFALPAIWLILRMSANAVVQNGLLTPLGLAGAVSALLCAIPNALMIFGATRSAARVLRTTVSGSWR